MTITSATLTPRPQPQPTSAIPQGQAPVIADGVPSNVKPVPGQPDQVAFTMKGDKGQVDLVWDKAKNELFVKGQDGTLSKASLVERSALLNRLSDPAFAPIRKGSSYDLMRQDIMEAKASEPRLPTDPVLPKPPVTSSGDLYKVTEADFLAANRGRTVTTEDLRAGGLDARQADANGDGAISGAEWKGVWRAVDAADKNGDARSVDSSNAAVKQRLDAVQGAQTGKAPYTRADLAKVGELLDSSTIENLGEVQRLSDAAAARKGLPRGTAFIKLTDGNTGSSGVEPPSVSVYRTPDGRWFKELNDQFDGKNTPVVALTKAELQRLQRNSFLAEQIHTTATDSRDARYQLAREFGGAGH